MLEKLIYLVFIILLVAIVVVEPRFLSFNNFKNIFAQSSTKIIIALAAGMVLVVQGVDLSTGRMIGLAAVIFASLVQNPDYAYRMYPNLKELPLIVPLLLVLAICLVLGGISGVLVAVFKVTAVYRNAWYAVDLIWCIFYLFCTVRHMVHSQLVVLIQK